MSLVDDGPVVEGREDVPSTVPSFCPLPDDTPVRYVPTAHSRREILDLYLEENDRDPIEIYDHVDDEWRRWLDISSDQPKEKSCPLCGETYVGGLPRHLQRDCESDLI